MTPANTAMPTIVTPTPIPAFAPVLKPLDGCPVPVLVCAGDPDDVVAEEVDEEEDVVTIEDEDVEAAAEVTAVLPTENVAVSAVGAGSSKTWVVGSLQLTVKLSDSVPQQDQSCVWLLYTMSARGRDPVAC